ncbi:hypothetical protein SDC9_165057 [bioreactor metagenome]|uniref:Uncharacterized protein n=1 Tax=bioreactor metagenome TaxID=1076179 RepID=A0A645FVN1_9ZZZZ|nr:hypothetical protein [Clostridium sp. HMP27]
MDKDIKDVLLNIQSEVKQINNKLNEMKKTQLNGNYVYTDEHINSNDDKGMD